MKTLPVSGALALAVIAAAIALAAAFAGSGKASASEQVVDCAPVQITPEIVWGGLLVVPNLDGNHSPSNAAECQTASCVASGGKCGTCTDSVGSARLISRSSNADGVIINQWSRETTTTCSCGYHGTRTITWQTES